MPGDTLFKSLAGVSAIASTTPDADAAHAVRPPIRFIPTGAAADASFTWNIATTDTAITIQSARYIPTTVVAASDTNNVSLTLRKGDLAGGALTTFGAAKTTQLTGGTAMAVNVPWVWTIVTAASANVVAVDQVIVLVMTETGTGPAWQYGCVEIYYTLTN